MCKKKFFFSAENARNKLREKFKNAVGVKVGAACRRYRA